MKTLLAAAGLISLAGAAQAQLTNAAPRPAAEPFRETVFGQTIQDDWRWMERADRADDVTDFIRSSSARTVAQLAALPGRGALRNRVNAGTQAGVRYSDVRQASGALFYRRTDPGAQLAKLVMRSADGSEHILYNPETGTTRGPAINNYSVAPDGRTIALHTAAGGGEVGAIRFIDTASGNAWPDRLEPVWGEFEAQWLDNRTVAYTRMAAPSSGVDQMLNMHVFVHRIGASDGAPVLGAGVIGGPAFVPQEFPATSVLENSNWVVGSGSGARADYRLFVARRADLLAGRPAWRVIGDYSDRLNGGAIIGDALYLITTNGASNGKVIRVDLARNGTLANARIVVPESNAILVSAAAGDDGLYLLGQTDGISRLFFLANNARRPVEVALPMQGNAVLLQPAGRGSGVTFGLQDWFTAPRWFRARGRTVTPLGLDSASYGGIRGARQMRESATSADGTRVPMAILLPPGAQPGRPLPMLLDGYGSYGVNNAEPFYAQYMFGLLETGGAVAYCGTRGGGERGRAWHEGGRAANKPNAQADLIACGERLVQLGLTTSNRMTVMGTSAGGLLAPPAALRRPDLFGALISNVGIVDPIRLGAAENGANQFAEMGDPNTPDGFRALLAQDAYQMLGTATDMPDTLITVGLNDHRVTPWFSAKFAARALNRFGSRRLVMIRTDPEAGHGIGSARQQLVEQWADMFAFVLNQAGAEGFTTP